MSVWTICVCQAGVFPFLDNRCMYSTQDIKTVFLQYSKITVRELWYYRSFDVILVKESWEFAQKYVKLLKNNG